MSICLWAIKLKNQSGTSATYNKEIVYLKSADVEKRCTVPFIYTEDATADETDIRLGKTAYSIVQNSPGTYAPPGEPTEALLKIQNFIDTKGGASYVMYRVYVSDNEYVLSSNYPEFGIWYVTLTDAIQVYNVGFNWQYLRSSSGWGYMKF